MPRLVHGALLMTYTPEPLSQTHPFFSVPCTRTLMGGFRWSMIVGPRLGSVKRAGMVLCDVCSLASIAFRNHGTKFISLLIMSVIGQSARAAQSRSTSVGLTTSVLPGAFVRRWLRWPLLPIPVLLSLCHPPLPILSTSLCSVVVKKNVPTRNSVYIA